MLELVLDQVPSGVFLETRAPDRGRRSTLGYAVRRPVLDSNARCRFSGATLIEEDDPILLRIKEAPVRWIGSTSGTA